MIVSKAVSAQMPTRVKLTLCDTPLNNDGSMEDLHETVSDVCARLRHEARSHICSFLHKRTEGATRRGDGV